MPDIVDFFLHGDPESYPRSFGIPDGKEVIREYFQAGYTNDEMCSLLGNNHDIYISVRTLKRKLRSLGLRRRSEVIDHQRVVHAVQDCSHAQMIFQSELQGSGCCLGYRSMTARLRNVHGLRIPRDYVMHLLRTIDPDGVMGRRYRRFTRRLYYNKGPNYLIHIDGYDKLKPFGFAIHGAICGYSRRILWLKVGRSNNDPFTVAHYFMEYVERVGGVPRCIRADRGSENVFIEDLQKAIRWHHTDDMAAENSFIYGSSHRNQRIERWWLSMRQSGGEFWINLFRDMESQGIVATDNSLHIECLRFCFTELIQCELDKIATEWNQHSVRRTADNSGGKPDILYFLPERHGTADYKTEVDPRDIHDLKMMCKASRPSGCEADFEEVCETLLHHNGKTRPSDSKDAMDLFAWLVTILD